MLRCGDSVLKRRKVEQVVGNREIRNRCKFSANSAVACCGVKRIVGAGQSANRAGSAYKAMNALVGRAAGGTTGLGVPCVVAGRRGSEGLAHAKACEGIPLVFNRDVCCR